MEKQKTKFGLLVKVLFSVAFAAVFVINMITVVQKDTKSGNLTLSSMKSYAQGGEGGVTINCPSYGYGGKCFTIVEDENGCTCEYTGITNDNCDEWNAYYCFSG